MNKINNDELNTKPSAQEITDTELEVMVGGTGYSSRLTRDGTYAVTIYDAQDNPVNRLVLSEQEFNEFQRNVANYLPH